MWWFWKADYNLMNTRPEGLVRLPSFPYSTFNGRVRISSAEQEKTKVSSAFLRNQGYKRNECDASPPCGCLISADSCLSEIPLSPRIPTIAGPAATNTMEGRLMLNTSSELCKQVVFQICQLVSNFADLNQRKEKHWPRGHIARQIGIRCAKTIL